MPSAQYRALQQKDLIWHLGGLPTSSWVILSFQVLVQRLIFVVSCIISSNVWITLAFDEYALCV